MSLDVIKVLPVLSFAAEHCVLFLWAIDTHLPEALGVIRAWGFRFATVGFTWAKTNPKSGGFFAGCGWWTRANTEMCLLATRGSPKRLDRSVRRLVVAPRREHSRKPDEVYTSIQRLVTGPYLECFARTRREGWDQAFSDQPDRFEA
jgi:N6-adenosine-specific RNA methylase IME4